MTTSFEYPIGTRYGVPGKMWAAGHHTGEDFLAPTGTTVTAPCDGKIIAAGRNGWGSAYGVQVIGETVIGGSPIRWITAHMKSVSVAPGQVVKRGESIGVSNNTGNTSGPHVHLEARHWPYNYGDDIDPKILFSDEKKPTPPKPGTMTLFEVSFWNVASPKWFKPWAPRAKGISDEIRGEASVYGFAEVFSEEQARDLQKALGSNFTRVSGHAGLEFWYDSNIWQLQRPVKAGGYASEIQGRYALVVHLLNKLTGQHIAFVVTHAPALRPDLRVQFGAWLKKLLGQIDGPTVLMGDFNTSKNGLSPRKDIRSLGFRDMREQAAVKNESANEFPSKKSSLADIYTVPGKSAVTDGQIDLTSAQLSDHRRIEATVTVTS